MLDSPLPLMLLLQYLPFKSVYSFFVARFLMKREVTTLHLFKVEQRAVTTSHYQSETL